MINNKFVEKNMLLDTNVFDGVQLHDIYGMDEEDELYTEALIPCIKLDVKRYDHLPEDADEDTIEDAISERIDNAMNLAEISIDSVLAKTLLRFYENLDKCSNYPELAEQKGWIYFNKSLWFTSDGISAQDDVFDNDKEANQYFDFINHQTPEELEEELRHSSVDLTTMKVLAMHDLQYQDDIMWVFRRMAYLRSGFSNIDLFDAHVVRAVEKQGKVKHAARVIEPQDELDFYLEELGYGSYDDPNVYVLPCTSQVRRKFDTVKIKMKYDRWPGEAIIDDGLLIILTNDTPAEMLAKLSEQK